MDKRKLKIALSLAVLIPCVLYTAGIIAQFIININAWKSAGSDYRTSPGLPSSQISEVVRALFHFPEGLIAIGVVVLGIAVLCVFGLRIGWGQNGVTDSDRNLTVSNSGSYGTASFMSPKEASACFEVTSAKRTSQDILGMLPDGQVLTLPKDTRLNANLAVCGSSGTGKSRAISRNLVLQAVKRGESVILTDPKSELYESMGEYLRENGYIVKVFNLVEMDHSDSWNCLGEVGSSELMAQTFADIVLQNTSGDSKDAFWYNAELNLLKALVLYVALEMPPEKRNIATVYDLLYEKCGRLHLKVKNPELRIDRLKDIPEGVIAIEVDQAVAKKLFGQTIAIRCYDNTVEHTVGEVNGSYWFKVDIGSQEGESNYEEEP